MTSLKSKGKYDSEPLNRISNGYDMAGPSGTKDVSSESSFEKHNLPQRKAKPKAPILKSIEEITERKGK